ncbi:hypothetical protein [Kistimonas asteriae]|uniref:hypothetical protein n=1 Tax=Kistimonas asteriae TaxID=517724 RepID=UPI001BA9CF84|nr:hypothetical protein [Kistimonas asteriae]
MAQDIDARNRGMNGDDTHEVVVLIQEVARILLDERQQLGLRVEKHFRQLEQRLIQLEQGIAPSDDPRSQPTLRFDQLEHRLDQQAERLNRLEKLLFRVEQRFAMLEQLLTQTLVR